MKVVYIVQAYETKSEEGQMTDVVTLEVYAKTEKEAIKKCEQYVKKKGYRVSQIIEK